MIDESLIKSNFIGRDSFRWWIGQIAPIEAQNQNEGEGWGNRYKVRILDIIHLVKKIYLIKIYHGHLWYYHQLQVVVVLILHPQLY